MEDKLQAVLDKIDELDDQYRTIRVGDNIQQAKEADLFVHVLHKLYNYVESLSNDRKNEQSGSDFDAELASYINANHGNAIRSDETIEGFTTFDAENIARHFVEWQKKSDDGRINDLRTREKMIGDLQWEAYLRGEQDTMSSMIDKACRCYCDDLCDQGCGICFCKHDSEGQVKNDFKYNECNKLKTLRYWMEREHKPTPSKNLSDECIEREMYRYFSSRGAMPLDLARHFAKWAEHRVLDRAMDEGTLVDWYISSIDETDPPCWTEEHIAELCKDFYVIPRTEEEKSKNT